MGEPIEDFISDVTPAMVIVPDTLDAAINAKLDAAFSIVPDAAKDRDELRSQLLAFFSKYGYLPDFELAKRADG